MITTVSGFANLRTRPGQPTSIKREERFCPECGKRLSRYTEEPLCMTCEDRQTARKVEREIEQARLVALADERERKQKAIDAALPQIAHPVTPTQTNGLFEWRRLVEWFVFVDMPAVVIDADVTPAHARNAINSVLRTMHLMSACQVRAIEGRCYLTRKEVTHGQTAEAPCCTA